MGQEHRIVERDKLLRDLGSFSKTSSPAAKIVPVRSASISAVSSTSVPRAILTRTPSGPSARKHLRIDDMPRPGAAGRGDDQNVARPWPSR